MHMAFTISPFVGHAKMVSVGQILQRAAWWTGQGWDYHWPRNGWEIEPIVGKPDL
jgi:hypothetical protein